MRIASHLLRAPLLLGLSLLLPTPARTEWIKPLDPPAAPPDVDKLPHGDCGRLTCFIATAANMLAGAGYGNGATVQARADAIYLQLRSHFGTFE
ncbi:hypothetical protein RAS1_06630 [Phycisphaerae bacterium RAS1]|nr:hypothetical protein RAS1_06630 [Phycisphaerae bacterium RAS1]